MEKRSLKKVMKAIPPIIMRELEHKNFKFALVENTKMTGEKK